MSYNDTAAAAVQAGRLPLEDSYPTKSVVVLGLPSSGTRLVTRLLAGSRYLAVHDARHGVRDRRWATERAVIVTRDPAARTESAQARWGDQQPAARQTVEMLRVDYPDALEIRYEDVVADKDAVIVELAAALEVDPWLFTEPIFDANAEPGSRDA